MKTLRLVIVSMICAAFLAIAATAQTTANAKIALINTNAFYNVEGGITKIANGYKKLNAEMKPMLDQYNTKATQYNNLKKAYDELVQRAGTGVPVDEKDAQTKGEQLLTLKTEITRMQEDIKNQKEKREAEIMEPINKEIGQSLETYSKQKGYTLVMDIGPMVNAQMLLYLEPTIDITKDFITFYNAKPAGTATK